MTRLLAAFTLTCAMLFVVNWLLQRLVAAVLVVMLLALTGCTFTVPTQPETRWCFPAKSWKCSPYIEWSLM